MTTPTTGGETCPGLDYSISQLLHAAKRKLHHVAFGGRFATTVSQTEVDELERDALEVLCLIRTVKNSFAPISRITPEVLSLIPDYYGEGNKDKDLIASTHVCRGWRDALTSRPLLWVRLDFKNVERTRTYIQRSQSSPLKIRLGSAEVNEDAFTLVIPHIHRLKSLIINADALPSVLEHFRCHAPLLEQLYVNIRSIRDPVLDVSLFNGDLSSLRGLYMRGVETRLPWKNLVNLQVVNIDSLECYGTTQILDFLESAPLLRKVSLSYLMPPSSDAPPERIATLRHLRHLEVKFDAEESHLVLLRHIRIPTGASLISRFTTKGEESPLLDYLPERSPNFANLSHITTIDLLFGKKEKFARLSGPSGTLRIHSELIDRQVGSPSTSTLDHQILRSLCLPILSTPQRLAISKYDHPTQVGVEVEAYLQTLNGLRTLILIECDNLPFILALDPERNRSGLAVCPAMEQLVLYVKSRAQFRVEHFISMAKNRASKGAKISSITFVDLGGLAPVREALRLREHVTRVEYRVDDVQPRWDDDPV